MDGDTSILKHFVNRSAKNLLSVCMMGPHPRLSSDGIQLNVTNNSHSGIIEIKGPNVTIVYKYYCMMYRLVVGQNIHHTALTTECDKQLTQ